MKQTLFTIAVAVFSVFITACTRDAHFTKEDKGNGETESPGASNNTGMAAENSKYIKAVNFENDKFNFYPPRQYYESVLTDPSSPSLIAEINGDHIIFYKGKDNKEEGNTEKCCKDGCCEYECCNDECCKDGCCSLGVSGTTFAVLKRDSSLTNPQAPHDYFSSGNLPDNFEVGFTGNSPCLYIGENKLLPLEVEFITKDFIIAIYNSPDKRIALKIQPHVNYKKHKKHDQLYIHYNY